jgi:hypothetical protein
MKHLLFVIILSLFLTTCEKEDKPPCACGVENPQINLDWLKFRLEHRFCTEIYLYTLNGQEFIGVHDCPTMFDGGWVIYNCDGSMYCQFIGLNAQCDCPSDFLENATKVLIYKQRE